MATEKKVLTKEDAFALMNEFLISDEALLRGEFARRNVGDEFEKVGASEATDYIENGWTEVKRYKKAVKVKRPKRHDVQLEDDVWCLFRRAGYSQLNKNGLKVPYERDDGTVDRKQIDVYARDEETVLVIECKSRENRGRRSLQKDLAETKAFKGQMASTIRAFYGADFKPKIIWIYVTRNIIWSEPDLDRAKEVHVHVVTENELQYYEAFIQHMGPAGRFQILAEFLEGQKIPELENIKVPAIRGKLGGSLYYAFVTTPQHLLKISFVNHLALNHPDGRPAYQRMIKSGRLKAIGEFIAKGGYFPTNLLVNFSEECRFDFLPNKEHSEETVKFGWLTLPSRYKSAWIIDGQHRLYGYSRLDKAFWNQNLFVLAFEKLDNTKEAELFITINHEQKSVPKSILVSLQADLKWGAENPKDRIAALTSALIKSLAADATGPLGQKFIIEGVPGSEDQSLTIPEAAKGIDRSRLIGRFVNEVWIPGPLSGATDEMTIKRAKRVINGFFESVRSANETRWEMGRPGYVATNPGIRAYLQLLAEVLVSLERDKGFEAETASEQEILDEISVYTLPVRDFLRKATDEQMQEQFGRKFGEGGVKDYFYNLCEILSAKFKHFGSAEFKEYLAAKSDSRYGAAHADVNKLAKDITDYVYDKLVETYGIERTHGGEEAYMELGVQSAKAKLGAHERRLKDPIEKRLNVFAYLDILDLRDVVKQQNNWPHFESVFSIQMPEEQKGKKYYLDWMEEFNELRRIPGHPSKLRLYRDSDYEFIEWLKKEFYKRYGAAK